MPLAATMSRIACFVFTQGTKTDVPTTNLSQSITMRTPSGDMSVLLNRISAFCLRYRV